MLIFRKPLIKLYNPLICYCIFNTLICYFTVALFISFNQVNVLWILFWSTCVFGIIVVLDWNSRMILFILDHCNWLKEPSCLYFYVWNSVDPFLDTQTCYFCKRKAKIQINCQWDSNFWITLASIRALVWSTSATK